ncbi:MAG TPA: mechanosensitive ion channel domain-containing protein [Bacillus sp. (in: firmicutes)]|nr:mechanosensitive ion channel domain-containing protein [Bacillus sp. (in: firmicutes)]
MNEFTKNIINFFEIDWESVKDYFLSLCLTTVAAYLVITVFRFLLHQFFKRTHLLDEKKEQTIESVVKNTSNYIVFVVILIAAIKPFVGDLKELVLAGGIIAAVIGFGAQKLINDLLSGMFMIFEQTIRKGDFVNINGEPEGGTIEELGFRVVKIRLINGKLVTIPNGEIRKMVNGSVEKRRVFESIVVSFNENPRRVKELLQEVCDELNVIHKDYLKKDKLTGEFVEAYQLYGLHSLDVSPIGYKFSITATVNDTDYLTAAQETKELLAQKIFDNNILMPAQQIVMQQSNQTQNS